MFTPTLTMIYAESRQQEVHRQAVQRRLVARKSTAGSLMRVLQTRLAGLLLASGSALKKSAQSA